VPAGARCDHITSASKLCSTASTTLCSGWLTCLVLAGIEELRAAAPDGIGEPEWATLLVTAFLRKRLGAERALWSEMDVKATHYLSPRWRPINGASLGAGTIAAMKLL